jgi:hypothetical protein
MPLSSGATSQGHGEATLPQLSPESIAPLGEGTQPDGANGLGDDDQSDSEELIAAERITIQGNQPSLTKLNSKGERTTIQ